MNETKKTVLVAVCANATIAVVKGIPGVLSGSSALLAECAHSIADTANQRVRKVSPDGRTSVVIAGYSLVDKAGVARIHPVPDMALMEAGTAVCLLPAARRRVGALEREWRARPRSIVAVGAMSALAYLLVLFAFQLSKAAYVVASRELSIPFSAVIGSLWLGEGRLGPRLAAASVILAGVLCVAFAR